VGKLFLASEMEITEVRTNGTSERGSEVVRLAHPKRSYF
jgi:hypothetical protein